ncbi:uncharacterized protein RNJ42_04637 [Nakaseomyces bracarensis]|uniref:uncharacterized protein n=1 Tax=Nakaseomyces bracarensis TaxID=273131 RepID=UPI0038718DFD
MNFWNIVRLLLLFAVASAKSSSNANSNTTVLYSSWNVTVDDDFDAYIVPFRNSSNYIFYNDTNVFVLSNKFKTTTNVLNISNYDSTYLNVNLEDSFDNIGYVYYNATLLVTYDKGLTWNTSNISSNPMYSIDSVIAAPTNSSVLLIHAEDDNFNDVFYISYNNGSSFQQLEVEGNKAGLSFVFQQLSNATTALIGVNDSGEDTIFYYSSDFGKSFNDIPGLENATVSNWDTTQAPYLLATVKQYNNDDDLDTSYNISYYSSKNGQAFNKIYGYLGSRSSLQDYSILLGDRFIYTPGYNSLSEDYYDSFYDFQRQDDIPAYNLTSLFYISDSDGEKLSTIGSAYKARARSSLNAAKSLPGTEFLSSYFGLYGFSNVSSDNGITWTNPRIVDSNNQSSYTCNISDTNCTFVIKQIQEDYSTGTIIATGHESFWDPKVFDIDTFLNNSNYSPYTPSQNDISFSNLNYSQQVYVYRATVQDFFAISNDGGYTWRKLFGDSDTTFFTSNYANTLVVLNTSDSSNLNISLNQGATWKSVKLSFASNYTGQNDLSMDPVTNTFTLFSRKEGRKNDYGFFYALNITETYNLSMCDPSKDLVKFSLNKGGCVNGARYTSFAKNSTSTCILNSTDTTWNITACDRCTVQDYICAPQFTLNSKGICVPDKDYLNSKDISCVNNSTKLPSMVLIEDNMCKTKINMTAVPVSC